MSGSTFSMFGKLSQKFLPQNDKELSSELSDMQERYNSLKQSHELTLQMLGKAKQSDNSLSEAYQRLQKQFQDLTVYIKVKKAEENDKLLAEHQEIAKQKDFLNNKQQEIEAKENLLSLRTNYLEIFSDKS